MKDLKVLMVIAVFHPYIGGAEKQSERLALELLKKNIEVTIVTGRWSNILNKFENLNDLKIIRNLTNFKFCSKGKLNTEVDFFKPDLSVYRKKLKFIRVFFRKIFIRTSIYIYQISLFLFMLCYRKNYDIIHVHQVLYPAFISTIVARFLKKPVLVKVGNSGLNSDIRQIKKFPEGKYQLRYILKNIDKLVYTNNKMKEEFLKEGIDKGKIIFIPNGVRVSNFNRFFGKCKNLLYMGRFIQTKNIKTLILAFSKVILITSQNLRLILVGDGQDREDIISLIKRLKLEGNILLTGMVKNPGYFLKNSDLFISASLSEGLSNSLIEAMSYKLPCIVSNIPGNAAVIGEPDSNYRVEDSKFIMTEYGILFNPTDVEGLVNSIIFLLKDSNTRKKLGESAYWKVKREYNIKVVAEKYKELYKEVLKY